MATQNYRGRLTDVPPGEDTAHPDHPVHGDQARAQMGLNAKNPTAGANKTPPPIKAFDPTARDKTFGRASGNPGSNAWGGASSLAPGQTTVDVAAVKQPDADQTLDLVKAKGVGGHGDDSLARDGKDNLVNSQLRTVSDKGFAPAHGMKSPNNPGERVPTKVGFNEGTVARQPPKGSGQL